MADNDAQYNVQVIARPFDDFEDLYQGQSGERPILFPGGRDSAAAAGKPGFDPNLAAGIRCPKGARCQIVIPTCNRDLLGAPGTAYRYRLIWRDRSVASNDGRVQAGHYPNSRGIGSPAITPGAGTRFPVLSHFESQQYVEDEPSPLLANTSALVQVVPRDYVIRPRDSDSRAYLPGGDLAVIEQGVHPLDVARGSTNAYTIETLCLGDDLVIECRRVADPTVGNWDFTSPNEDYTFSVTFGRSGANVPGTPENQGIKVSFGNLPG